jgi:hypothetical protein
MENTTTPNPMNGSTVHTPPPAAVQTPKSSSNIWKITTVIFVALFLLMTWLYLGTKKPSTEKLTTTQTTETEKPTPTPQTTASPSPAVAAASPKASTIPSTKSTLDTKNWKTYTNTSPKYTIKYPSDWQLDSSKAEFDEENKVMGASLMISKGEYRLDILWPTAYGPSACVFEDQPDFSKEDLGPQMGRCTGKFKQITSVNGKLRRRLLTPSHPDAQALSYWSVYTKEEGSSYYVTVPPIQYMTPGSSNDDPQMEVLDTIVSTFNEAK